MGLAKAIEDKTLTAVIEFIDGTKVSVKGSAASIFEQMLNNQQSGVLG
jgi:hypothetical protein